MFSPNLLLGALLAIVAVGLGSYRAGYSNGSNAAESERARAQDAAIAVVSAELEAQRQRAVSEAAARAKAVATANAQRIALSGALKELNDVKDKPVGCVPDDWRVRLNSAIDAANSPLSGERYPGFVPDAMPKTAPDGVGFKPMGRGVSGISR